MSILDRNFMVYLMSYRRVYKDSIRTRRRRFVYTLFYDVVHRSNRKYFHRIVLLLLFFFYYNTNFKTGTNLI